MEVNKGSDQKSDIYPSWIAAHARLKNEFTEDEKYHYLMSWFIIIMSTGPDHVPNVKQLSQIRLVQSNLSLL